MSEILFRGALLMGALMFLQEVHVGVQALDGGGPLRRRGYGALLISVFIGMRLIGAVASVAAAFR